MIDGAAPTPTPTAARPADPASTPAPASDGRGRVHGLDGLRGVAALVVVVFHALLCVPVLDRQFRPDPPPLSPLWTALIRTPLHVAFAGTEAVYVFFVLSGYVLTLAARRAGFGWAGYAASRTLRLYLPVAGAVTAAMVLFHLHRRVPLGPGASSWLSGHGYTPTVHEALADLTLVGPGAGSWLDSPLWSLKWEVLFSLALPLYLLVAVTRPGWWRATLPAAVAVVFVAQWVGSRAGIYLPMFAVGAVLAVRDRDPRTAARAPGHPGLLLAVGLVLLPVGWYLPPELVTGPVHAATTAGSVVGAGCVVAAVAGSVRLDRALSGPVLHHLGSRSFSLYLIHEPVLILIGLALAPHGVWWPLVLGVPLSLVAAEVFFRVVERPSHRLAGRAGRAVDAAVRRRTRPDRPTRGRETPGRSRATVVG